MSKEHNLKDKEKALHIADVSKRCSDCGGDATIAMTSWRDNTTGKQYYKKGERRCMSCHKKHTGIGFSFH